MQSPAAFRKACRNLAEDMSDFVSSMDDLVRYSLLGIDAADAAEIRPFLDDLLSGRYDHDQLMAIWPQIQSYVRLYEGRDVVTFLTRMREFLDAPGPPYLVPKD